MRTWAILMTAGPLATACTTADVVSRPALATFTSQRSVAEIATCLSTAYAERRVTIKTERTDRGVVLVASVPISGFSSVLDTVSIDDIGTERTVTLRSKAKKAPPAATMDALFRPCL